MSSGNASNDRSLDVSVQVVSCRSSCCVGDARPHRWQGSHQTGLKALLFSRIPLRSFRWKDEGVRRINRLRFPSVCSRKDLRSQNTTGIDSALVRSIQQWMASPDKTKAPTRSRLYYVI